MREYLSVNNLKKSLLLGGMVAVMSTPRIILGGMDPVIFVPAAFFSMTLVAGAAAAWGEKGGMAGLFPGRRRTIAGIIAAVMIALASTPLHYFCLDPLRYAVIKATGNGHMIEMLYPSTLYGCVSLVLWSASFETIFFPAASMSFFSRLTGRMYIALVLTVAMRIFVMSLQVSGTGMDSTTAYLIYSGTAISSLVACLLFALTGLVPTMVYCGLINLHVFVFLVKGQA